MLLNSSSMTSNSLLRSAIEGAFAQAASAVYDAVSSRECNAASDKPLTSADPLPPQLVAQAAADSPPAAQAAAYLQSMIEQQDDDMEDFQPDSFLSPTLQPSRVGRRYCSVASRGGRKLKRSHKTAVRTIVCLPLQLLPGYTPGCTLSSDYRIPFPRGKTKEKLYQCGLIAKVNFVRTWNPDETTTEICNLFKLNFDTPQSDVTQTFGYIYLATYPGLRSLTKPKVNKRFLWDATAVLSLHRTTIHILSNTEHQAFNEKKESLSPESLETPPTLTNDEVIDTDSLPELRCTSTSYAGRRRQPSSLYDDYVNLLSSDEDSDFQEALEASFTSGNQTMTHDRCEEDDYSVEDSLSVIQNKICEEKVNLVNVNRRRLLEGATRAITRKSFQEDGRLNVKFSDDIGRSEGAIDAGGPTREFLRLAVAAAVNSSIFEGPDTNKCLAKCKTAAANDLYFVYGRIFALSLLHGGSGPHCFSRLLYNQILDLPRKFPSSLLQPSAVHDQVIKIENSTSEEEFNQALEEASVFLQTAGIAECQFNHKDLIVKECARFYLEDRVRSELNRFVAGLDCLGLVQEMKKCPIGYGKLFLFTESPLSATIILDQIFDNIELSENGSNTRCAEDDTICYWRDYVVELEDGTAESTLHDLLIFATGAACIPPLGFTPKPQIKFTQESSYPIANTCAIILFLPLCRSGCSYENFKANMDFGILNSHDFGRA